MAEQPRPSPVRVGLSRSNRARVISLAFLLAIGTLVGVGALAGSQVAAAGATNSSVVWLCRPGLSDDPCTTGLSTTVVSASGSTSTVRVADAPNSKFDCFYVYPTVSRELTANADLRVQRTEIDVAIAQAARFSRVCRVYAPIYRQVTLAGLAESTNLDVGEVASITAYDSIKSALENYLGTYNDGRPIVFIGHSQGSAMLILLLQHLVDDVPALRSRLVMAIILGGNVTVPVGHIVGGTFSHIPLCNAVGETGCVIAYSSFPSTPPQASLFGRPGKGVSLQSDQRTSMGLVVACTNPAALRGGRGELDPFFPSEGAVSTPWVSYPGLYSARCEQKDGASWLEVRKTTGSSDRRPVVTEVDGPNWGYHAADVNLALGNLIEDVSDAEASWLGHHA